MEALVVIVLYYDSFRRAMAQIFRMFISLSFKKIEVV